MCTAYGHSWSAQCLDETSNKVQFVCLGGICVLPMDVAGLPSVWMKSLIKFSLCV